MFSISFFSQVGQVIELTLRSSGSPIRPIGVRFSHVSLVVKIISCWHIGSDGLRYDSLELRIPFENYSGKSGLKTKGIIRKAIRREEEGGNLPPCILEKLRLLGSFEWPTLPPNYLPYV